jgi:hypothetical protein
MHDGSLATLCELMLRHPVSEPPGGSAVSQPAPVKLTPEDGRDLLVFLETLTAADGRRFHGGNSAECR